MDCKLPPAIVRALREPAPTAADFVPTRFTPADTKSWFACHLLRFVSADFPRHQFTERFYRQVMHTFSFIAHYDSAGFWTEYFTGTAGKVEFIEQVVRHPCYGDPRHTFSDVEREIGRRLRQVDLLDFYRRKDRSERDAAERAEFARLKARFEPGGVPVSNLTPTPPPLPASARAASRTEHPGQLSFAIG